jgi:hypothetical protein
MRTKLTDGNWRIGLRNELVIVSDKSDGTKPTIAACSDININNEESKANAKLMAASKDLLEAMIVICNDANVFSLGESGETTKVMIDSINKGIKAIKKATE